MAYNVIPTEEEYYNMKHGGTGTAMPATQNQPQAVVPGNLQGETPQQFAEAKQNYNLFAQKPATAPVQPAGTVKNTNVGTGKVNTTDSPTYQAATETGGGTTRPITSMEDLATAMGYTSPQEEERLRKASIANQRILAVGDALRHIGNIYHTVQSAPSQQFNSPVEAERQRYLQGKAIRDKANLTYINYQQAKAAQDAKQRQWEAEQAAKERQFRYNAAKDERDFGEKQRQHNQNLEFNKGKQKATEDRWKRQDEETTRAHKASEALRRQSNGIAAGSLNLRKQEFEYKKQNGGTGNSRGAGGSTRAGHTYATKNGSVTLPADYLKDKINKRTILTQLERDGVVDQDWLNRYDMNQWNEKAQEKMLDDAVSSWLMNYDQAEGYMEKHFRGQRGGSATPGKQKIEGFGGSGKTKIQGFGGN